MISDIDRIVQKGSPYPDAKVGEGTYEKRKWTTWEKLLFLE